MAPRKAKKDPSAQPLVIFILNTFPVLSETFIQNEVLGLRRLGMNIHLYSLFRPQDDFGDTLAGELMKETIYLTDLVEKSSIAAAHLSFAFRFTRRYLGTLLFVLKHRSKAIPLFKLIWRTIRNRNQLTKQERQDLFVHFVLAVVMAKDMLKITPHHLNAHFADAAASFAMLIARLLNITYNITAHAYDIFTPQANTAEKFFNAQFVVTCTQFNKDYFLEQHPNYNASKVHVIYHGTDLKKFVFQQRRRTKVPVILSIGRLVPKKGMGVLLEACRLLKADGQVFQCRIVGDGPEAPKLKMFAKLHHLVQEVEFLGAVSPESILQYYHDATLFVLACVVEEDGNRDGIPNVLAEAMATGLPVISTKVSAIPELIQSGVDGVLIDQGEPAQLAATIKQLLQSPKERRSLGENAVTKVHKVFDAQVNLRRLLKIYDSYSAAS